MRDMTISEIESALTQIGVSTLYPYHWNCRGCGKIRNGGNKCILCGTSRYKYDDDSEDEDDEDSEDEDSEDEDEDKDDESTIPRLPPINGFQKALQEASRMMQLRYRNNNRFNPSTQSELTILKLENERLKKNLKIMEKALGVVSYNYDNLKMRIRPFKAELAIVQRTMIRIIRSHYDAPVAILVASKL